MIESERKRRQNMLNSLLEHGGLDNISPQLIRELDIYGGAQGIWVDKIHTAPLTRDNNGITVGLLHTGQFYSDDLNENGITYHYPTTNRPQSRDLAEIEATKNAFRLSLPVFIISLPHPNSKIRNVHLGWVVKWDDSNKTFQISFIEEQPEELLNQPETEFNLEDNQLRALAQVKVRPGQQRFSFRVFQRYGEQCAVCNIKDLELLDAAHIRSKRLHGSDDPRNGLVLCALHHRALDAGLFCINPETLAICYRTERANSTSLNITRNDLHHLTNLPHLTALQWLWGNWNKSK